MPHPRLIISDTALNWEWHDWKRLKPTYTTLLHMCDINHTTEAVSSAAAKVHTPGLMAFMTDSYHKQLMTLSRFPKFQQSVGNQFH